jgi:ABC-2 type transport system permease protein
VTALLVARRELGAYLRAPVAYVVGVMFLAVQGASFAALVAAMSDPARPAPMGAVLEGHFGGTLLHWALELAVIALVSMRAVAEDKRAGTWEALVTAPVGEGAAIVGKWLAACAFYALLWLPTLAYLIVLAVYAPAGASIDPGPIASAYVGEWMIGAALLAVGVAFSAMTASQIFAGAASFAAGMAILLAGEAVNSAPDWSAAHPSLAGAAQALSPRAHMLAFARGELALGALVFAIGLAVVGISAAIAAAGWGRRRDAKARAIGTALIAIVAVLLGVLAARHPRAWDVTRAHRNSLEPATRDVLAAMSEPVDATIVTPSLHGVEPVYDEASRVLDRIARAQPLVRVRRSDPAATLGGLDAIAREAGLAEETLSKDGAIVLARGARRRVIDLLDLASFGRDPLGAPDVTRLDAEGAIARAIAELDDVDPAPVCATSGHGELAWAPVTARLAHDDIPVEDAGAVASGVPSRCRVLIVAGPARPLDPAEVIAVRDWVEQGGALLAANAGGDTGLEPLFATYGVDVTRAVASEPALEVDKTGAFEVIGYGDDPLDAGFAGGQRVTVWTRPRVIDLRDRAKPLAFTTDSAAAIDPATGATVRAGRSVIAAAARLGAEHHGGVVVAFGGADLGPAANDLLFANAIERLAGRSRAIDVAAKTPEQVRLVMTSGERTAVVALCAGVIPLAYALLGLVVVLARRRRS